LEWVAGAAAAILLVVLAYFVFSSRETKKVVPAGASSRSVAISRDGTRLAVGLLDGSLRVIDLSSGKLLGEHKSEKPGEPPLSPITAVAFGPANSVLALRARESKLYIFSPELQSHTQRSIQPNAHDLVWSRALDAALVLAGGEDDLHAKIEVFPARPLGIQSSTAQLLNLVTWITPKYITVTGDGSRVAISYDSTRKMNVLIYDPRARRTTSALLLRGEPEGLAFAANGNALWVASPHAETVTEVTGYTVTPIQLPKLASTSPPRMIAVNQRLRRAYTTGSLTFPEIELDRRKITRTVELPERSAGIVLSPDESTAYLTFERLDIVGVVDLQAMRWVREIQLR
jgi:DNA-binding beta-propeller fold protein YncE